MQHDESIEQSLMYLDAVPAFLRVLVEAGHSDRYAYRPKGHYFAFVEHLWHLRDLEVEGYTVRIGKILDEEYPELIDFDGDAIAKERNYISRDWERAFTEFCERRAANTMTLRSVAPAAWERRGAFHSFGPVTLKDIVAMMREHDRSHVGEILHLGSACDIWSLRNSEH